MSKLLVVHHTTSPATQELLEAALSGLGIPELSALQVETRAALSATSADVLSSDGCLLLTPANIGYMSGAMKHFFDQIYYPCLQETRGRPYALVVHGNNDTTGAIRGVESICKGLDWRPLVQPSRSWEHRPAQIRRASRTSPDFLPQRCWAGEPGPAVMPAVPRRRARSLGWVRVVSGADKAVPTH